MTNPKHWQNQKKPWMRGKGNSTADGPGGNVNKQTLKNRLRNQTRMLQRVTDEKMKTDIQASIVELEHKIAEKNHNAMEKRYAIRYKQVKFFERKKLTRMEKRARRQLDEAKTANDTESIEKCEQELSKVLLNVQYVDHYPKDEKYIALFADRGNGIQEDDERTASKRGRIREKIAATLAGVDIPVQERSIKMCIAKSSDNSSQQRIKLMQYNVASEEQDDSKKMRNDEEVRTTSVGDKSSVKVDPPSSSSSDPSSDDSSSSDNSSCSSSDDESTDEPEKKVSALPVEQKATATFQDDSDDDDSHDDFFTENNEEEAADVFANATEATLERELGIRGDKSQGWATQRQRPGEFKRRRRN